MNYLIILLVISLGLNLRQWLRPRVVHVKVYEKMPGIWAHTLKTRKETK